MTPGPRNLVTDVAPLRVGNARDDGLKSGVTALVADRPFAASVAALGGAPGTHDAELLRPEMTVSDIDAIVLSGGSAFGLAACHGVQEALRRQGRGLRVGAAAVPIVPGAILFDLLNGGDKDWKENPYPRLGAEALASAAEEFEIGSFGAGTGALAANLKGGLGSASLVLPSGTAVGALVAVNPMGSPTTPGERHFHAAPFEIAGEFGGLGPDPAASLPPGGPGRKAEAMRLGAGPGANTTIAVVATDADLSKTQCRRMAIAAHDGIARAIVPAHTPDDGDLVFAVATGSRPVPDARSALGAICAAAAHCLARSIARAVYAASPAPGDLLPCWSEG